MASSGRREASQARPPATPARPASAAPRPAPVNMARRLVPLAPGFPACPGFPVASGFSGWSASSDALTSSGCSAASGAEALLPGPSDVGACDSCCACAVSSWGSSRVSSWAASSATGEVSDSWAGLPLTAVSFRGVRVVGVPPPQRMVPATLDSDSLRALTASENLRCLSV